MCTWFYADKATLSPIITKAQQLPLTDTIRNTMSRSAEMSGNIRPTDVAAVFAPNKQGNMAVFLHHGTTNGAYRPLRLATVMQMNSGTSKKKSMRYSRKGLRSHTLQGFTALRSIEVFRYRCSPS